VITLIASDDSDDGLAPEQIAEMQEALRNLVWEEDIVVLPAQSEAVKLPRPAPEFAAAAFGPISPLLSIPVDDPDPLDNDPDSPLIRTSPKLKLLLELYDELIEGILTPNSGFHFGRIREQLVKIDDIEKQLNLYWHNGKRQWNYRVC
jgi:hypothetical protein